MPSHSGEEGMNDATPSPNTSSCPSLPHVQLFLAGSTLLHLTSQAPSSQSVLA